MRTGRRIAWCSLALVALLGLSSSAVADPAEEPIELVNEEVVCPLSSVELRDDGTLAGTIARGALDGVILGGRGVVYRLLDTGELLTLGEATVNTVADVQSGVTLTPTDPVAGEFLVGDAVYVPSRVPRIEPPPVVWQLAIFGVTLLDEDEQPLFDYRAIVADPTADHDTPVFERGAEVVRELSWVADEVDIGQEPLATGRYAGKDLKQIMTGTTAEDVRDFLLYAATYPGDYIGQTWRFIDAYGYWALSELPASSKEIHLRASAMDPAARKAYLSELGPMLTDYGVVTDWYNEAHRLIRAGEYEAAHVLIDLMLIASGVTEVPRDWDLTWSALADVLDLEGDVEGSLEAYRKAIEVAADNPGSRSVSLNNIGGTLLGQNRFEEALDYYGQALDLKLGLIEAGEAGWGIEDTYWGIGRCSEMLYRYPEALEAYGQALEHYRARTDVKGLESETRTLLDLGDVHEALGNYAESIVVREQSLDVARGLGWTDSVATALDEISDGYWNLGDYARAIESRQESLALYQELGNDHSRAVCLTNLGTLLGIVGDLPAAISHYDQAQALHEGLSEWWDTADVLTRMAKDHRTHGNYTAALEQLQRARAIHAEHATGGDGADLALEMAENLNAQGRYEEADAEYERALAAAVETGDRTEEARGQLWWGVSLQLRKDVEGALERYAACEVIHAEIGDRAGQADALRNQALLHSALLGDHDRAIELGGESLALARAMQSKPQEAQALAVIGDALSNTGRFDEAFEHYQQALDLYEETGDQFSVTQTRASIGYLYDQWGEREKALALYQETIAAAREAGNRSQEAHGLIQRGWTLALDARYDEAITSAEQGLAIYEEIDEDWGVANGLNTLGSIHHDLGQYRESIEFYERSLEIRRSWGDPFGEAGSLNNLGSVHTDMADYETAAQHFEAAIEIGERIHYVDVLTASVGNLAYCYSEMGQHDKALDLASEGLATALDADVPPRIAELRRLVGLAHRELGEYDAAETMLLLAVEEADALGMVFSGVRAREQLGVVAWERGEFEQAEGLLTEAVETARQYPNPNQLWQPLFYLGRARRDLGDLDGAIAAYEESVATLDRMKAAISGAQASEERFQADHEDVYLELVDLLSRQGRDEEAWEGLGRMKTRELQELAPTDLSAVVAEEDREALGQVEELRTREIDLERRLRTELDKPSGQQRGELIDRLQTELDQVQLRFQDYTRTLEQEHPELYAHLQISPPSFFKLQADLQEGEAFLEPVILPDRIVTFVVRGGSAPLLFRETKVEEKDVNRLIRDMRARLEHPSVDWETTRGARALTVDPSGLDPTTSAMALHELLIEPVAEDLDGIETLIVSPSGRLRYVPFAALYDGEQYLVDRYQVVMMTQAGALADHEPIPRKAPLLAFGNPDGSLPGAEAEVGALQDAWSKKSVSAFVGADATKATLRQQVGEHQIIHLATHGVLLHDNPEGSYLLLAGEGSQAQLSFREIPLLPLTDVHLVVLSACHTAVGEKGEGKEIAGLAYQFEMRGADSVLASLWAVSDQSTTDLMLAFYEQLKEGKGTKAAALRAAQLQLRTSEEYGHPYYWAPFVLIGDWR